MGLGEFDEGDYGGVDDEGGPDAAPDVERDDRGGGAPDREPSGPCPGPPRHNPRCCLAPPPSTLSRVMSAVRSWRQG